MFLRITLFLLVFHLAQSWAACSLAQEKEQTPQQLIQSGKPDEAIEMMKRDRKWIYRSDPKDRRTPLHIAAQYSRLKVVQWLLENDADVYARAYNQLTALDFASDPEIVAVILKAKPELEPDRELWHSATPLQGAAKKYAGETEEPIKQKWLKITELMRAAGANYDLVSAVYLDDLPQVRKILATDPKDAHKHRPQTPLRAAAGYGRFEICRAILKVPGVDVNDLEQGCGYPIVLDALAHSDVVRLLIEYSADIKSRISWRCGRSGIQIIHDNAPLLHHAASRGTPDTVRLLLDQSTDPFVEIFDTHGNSKEPQTALDVAAVLGRVDNLLAIVRHTHFRDAEKSKRQPLLDRCLVSGSTAFQDDPVDHVSLYKGLLEAGANPNAIYNNRTAIQEAAGNLNADEPEGEHWEKKNESIRSGIKVLRAAGAKVDLFSAAALGDEATVREILKHSPKEASVVGPDGVPAMHMAIKLNNLKVVSLLLAAGCDVNLRNQSDNHGGLDTTPVDWAEFWDRAEILELLTKAKGLTSNELEDKPNQPPCEEQEQPPKISVH